jgi:hypothetical protein
MRDFTKGDVQEEEEEDGGWRAFAGPRTEVLVELAKKGSRPTKML